MSTLEFILWLTGLGGTLIGIIQFIAGASVAVSAIGGGLLAFAVVTATAYRRCLWKKPGPTVCTSGIINGFVPSFGSTWDYVFPFTAMHARTDVVVNPRYWPEVEEGAGFIQCAADDDLSPVLSGFHKEDRVCAAMLGSVIGAGVGAILGVVLMAVIGCGLVAWLCAIIALLVVALLTLLGALIGGNAGKAASEGRPLPPHPDQADLLLAGDYVAWTGTLIAHPDFDDAKVYWFVDGVKQMGRSFNAPPFSHAEAAQVWGCPLNAIVT